MLKVGDIVVLLATFAVAEQLLNVWEHNLLLISEMVVYLVVIIVIEFVDQSTAHFVEFLHHPVDVVVQRWKADAGVVAVRCAQICGNTLDVFAGEVVNLWAIVAERVYVADDEKKVGRDTITRTHLVNGGLAETELYIQALQD
jgi:hypothetical protein